MKRKMRILLIEDDMPVAMMMVHLLTRAGCEVTTASDAVQGMERVQSGDFDLITLDVDLPWMNGIEVCRRLKSDGRLAHIPVVFVSARSSEADVRRGFEAGAIDYITKPFDSADFVSRFISHARNGSAPMPDPIPMEAIA